MFSVTFYMLQDYFLVDYLALRLISSESLLNDYLPSFSLIDGNFSLLCSESDVSNCAGALSSETSYD